MTPHAASASAWKYLPTRGTASSIFLRIRALHKRKRFWKRISLITTLLRLGMHALFPCVCLSLSLSLCVCLSLVVIAGPCFVSFRSWFLLYSKGQKERETEREKGRDRSAHPTHERALSSCGGGSECTSGAMHSVPLCSVPCRSVRPSVRPRPVLLSSVFPRMPAVRFFPLRRVLGGRRRRPRRRLRC